MGIHAQPAGGMNAEQFFNEVGGLPMLSPEFRPSVLLTAVASVRRKAEPEAFPRLGDYLVPENAAQVFERNARATIAGIEADEMPEDRLPEIGACLGRIEALLPNWAPLFSIPIRYRMMQDGRISATSTLIPQTIFLGESAFRSTAFPFEETLVHEFAHVWLDFITEAFDLQTDASPRDLVLPSGTGGKSLRGVLLAAHFAAAAGLFYSRYTQTSVARQRGDYLYDYLLGCLKSISGHPELTPMGRIVWHALDEFAGRREHWAA